MKANVYSGFSSIDKITGGFENGELIFILSRPMMGKTLFALNIAYNAIINTESKICFFNVDMCMSKKELYRRVNSIEGKKILAVNKVPKIIYPDNLFVEMPGQCTLREIDIRSRMIQKSFGLDLIIVDYLQMVSMGKRMQGSARKLNEFVAGLKQLAEELKLPIIILTDTTHAPKKEAHGEHSRLAFVCNDILSPRKRRVRPLPRDIRGGKAPLKYGDKFLSLYIHNTDHGVSLETLASGVDDCRRYRNLEVNIWGKNNAYLGQTKLKFHDLQMRFKESKRKKIELKTGSLFGQC